MALPLQFTYARNASYEAITAGRLRGIRLMGLKGNMNADQPWIRVEDAAKVGWSGTPSVTARDPALVESDPRSDPKLDLGSATRGTAPAYGATPIDHFSSTCFYFGVGRGIQNQAAIPP